MTLGEAQRAFTPMVALLIQRAYDMGYELTLGDAYRDPRLHGDVGVKLGYGRSRSNHKIRLAIDLNLFKDGVYLASTEDHRPLGMWWEELGRKTGKPLSWGGHFNDGNHYSWEWEGRR